MEIIRAHVIYNFTLQSSTDSQLFLVPGNIRDLSWIDLKEDYLCTVRSAILGTV